MTVYTPALKAAIRSLAAKGIERRVIAKAVGVATKSLTTACWRYKIALPCIPRAVTSAISRKTVATEAATQLAMAPEELKELRRHRRYVQRVGRRRPETLAELQAYVAKATVPVTKCPPGAHAGWVPSWL